MEVGNINYTNILDLIDQVDKLGKDAHTNLAKPIIESIPSMVISEVEVNKSIGNTITKIQDQALAGANAIFKDIIDNMTKTQDMQSKEKPADFSHAPIEDLRQTIATGFPREDPLFFVDIPKPKI